MNPSWCENALILLAHRNFEKKSSKLNDQFFRFNSNHIKDTLLHNSIIINNPRLNSIINRVIRLSSIGRCININNNMSMLLDLDRYVNIMSMYV